MLKEEKKKKEEEKIHFSEKREKNSEAGEKIQRDIFVFSINFITSTSDFYEQNRPQILRQRGDEQLGEHGMGWWDGGMEVIAIIWDFCSSSTVFLF